MFNIFNLFFKKRVVGIDIGTSAIKMVELSRIGKITTLENYSELKTSLIKGGTNLSGKDGNLSLATLSQAIKEMLEESHIKTKSVIFSVPDFSTFCTSFEIPPMPKEEIPGAILYNATQYITLPISEVTLDWQVISNISNDKNSPLKVFLVAIPNQIIEDYKIIAKGAGLDLYALEAEVLGLKRSLINSGLASKKTVCLIDIGVQSSTLSIVDAGILKESYSFGFSADYLKNQGASKSFPALIEPMITEISDVCGEFLEQEKREIQEIYLTGGTANLAGLKEHLQETLKKNVSIPNCFLGLGYNTILKKRLSEISPIFSVAVGVALGYFEPKN